MAYKLPGNPGVTVYSSAEEARAAGKLDKVEQGSDGNLYATPHQGWLLRNMPWLVLGTMAAGAGMAAAGVGAGGAGGAAAFDAPAVSSAAGAANLAGIAGTGLPLGAFAPGLGAAGPGLVEGGGIGGVTGGANLAGPAATGLAGFLKDPKNYAGLAGLLATLSTRPGGNGGPGGGDPLAQNPDLNALLKMSADRAQRTDPLHQSITQLAMSRLPTNMQR